MDPRPAATRVPDPDAAEFIRYCYRRRRVGWPELYDEMCAVAARGLFRGLGTDDLATHGIGFSLFDMPSLAAMAAGIVAEEQALRRPMTVVLAVEAVVEAAIEPVVEAVIEPVLEVVVDRSQPLGRPVVQQSEPSTVSEGSGAIDTGPRGEAPVRFAAVPAGA
jgi:hypothetical protein